MGAKGRRCVSSESYSFVIHSKHRAGPGRSRRGISRGDLAGLPSIFVSELGGF